MENKSDIILITNTKGRLNSLTGIFTRLNEAKAGKLTKDHFCIESRLKLNNPQNKDDMTFNMLQEESYKNVIKLNCFCLNIDI